MDRELARAEVRLQTPHRHGAWRIAGCEGGEGEGQFILTANHKDSQGFHDKTVAGWGHQPADVAAGEQAQEHPPVPAPDQLHGRPDGGALQGAAAEEDEEEGAGSGEGGGSLWLKRRW